MKATITESLYLRCPPCFEPSGLRFDVPGWYQGRTIEHAFADTAPGRTLAGVGAPLRRGTRTGAPMRIHLSKWAQSTIEIYGSEDWSEEPEIAAVLAAWDGSAVRFEKATAVHIARGLCELSNREDAHYEQMRSKDPEGARMARWACEGLSNAAMRVAKAGA